VPCGFSASVADRTSHAGKTRGKPGQTEFRDVTWLFVTWLFVTWLFVANEAIPLQRPPEA
jgi:hypothetical protein